MPAKSLARTQRQLPDSEKLTINLGHVDLGRIDLLVNEGFYSTRSDFIRTAVRQHLLGYAATVQDTVARKTLRLGLHHITRAELEAAAASGVPLHIRVLGLASIAPDATPELVRAAIGSIEVLGTLMASAAVKSALADRMGAR